MNKKILVGLLVVIAAIVLMVIILLPTTLKTTQNSGCPSIGKECKIQPINENYVYAIAAPTIELARSGKECMDRAKSSGDSSMAAHCPYQHNITFIDPGALVKMLESEKDSGSELCKVEVLFGDDIVYSDKPKQQWVFASSLRC